MGELHLDIYTEVGIMMLNARLWCLFPLQYYLYPRCNLFRELDTQSMITLQQLPLRLLFLGLLLKKHRTLAGN